MKSFFESRSSSCHAFCDFGGIHDAREFAYNVTRHMKRHHKDYGVTVDAYGYGKLTRVAITKTQRHHQIAKSRYQSHKKELENLARVFGESIDEPVSSNVTNR